MRVLVNHENFINSQSVFESKFFWYTDNLYNAEKDEDKVEGLSIEDLSGNIWGIEGLDVKTCNKLFHEILVKGYLDLTMYGEIQFVFNAEDDE